MSRQLFVNFVEFEGVRHFHSERANSNCAIGTEKKRNNYFDLHRCDHLTRLKQSVGHINLVML